MRFKRRARIFGCWLIIAALANVLVPCARAEDPNYPLDAETMKNALRTRSPDEEAYLTYIATLVAQQRISRDLVLSTFQWARGKPYPLRVQYFKRGLNTRAAEIGIQLPDETPSLTGTIEGQVVFKVLGVKVPVPGAYVSLKEEKAHATANATGRFAFERVPLGNYTLEATGVVTLITRKGSLRVQLPTKPPSTEPLRVEIVID